MAGHRRTGQAGHLPPGARGRRPGRVRLHLHERPRRHHRPPAVRPPGVPLRPHVLELGVGDGVCVGVVRGPRRRPPERPVGTGRGAPQAPQRQPDGGRQQPVGDAGIPDPVPRPTRPLPAGRPADQRPPGARERRRRVVPRPLQDGRRSGVAPPRQPRVRHPRRVRDLPPRPGGRPQRRATGPLGRGGGGVETAARHAAGRLVGGAVPGRFGQPDPPPPVYVLGAQPADRRVGGRPPARRPRRDLVRGRARGHAAAAGRPGPARGVLPARDRLAGPQAGGVRPVRVPRRPVPDHPLPPGVRPVRRAARRAAAGEGVPGPPAPRGHARRGGRGRRPAGAVER